MGVIDVRGLTVALGGGPAALDGLELRAGRGEVVLVRGPSGSGKSTLLRVLGGLIPQFHGGSIRGRVRVGGADPLRARPGAMARIAALAFQDAEAQAVMATVGADVAFGPQCLGHPAGGIPATVARALELAGAAHLAHRGIATLSGGERQRAALAAVLAQRAPVLLLDEPTAQLDEATAAAVLDAVRRLADEAGATVLVAEHRADRAERIADRVVELAPPPAEGSAPRPAAVPGPVAAHIDGVGVRRGDRDVLRDVSLELRAGSVTALTGPNGSGKTSLLRVLAGLDAPAGGRVRAGGRDVTDLPAERRVPGVVLVPQDPGRHLITERVADELELGPRATGVPRAERDLRVGAALEAMDLVHLAGRHPLDLSVGERERVAIAAALTLRPRVLALDEPTRGMDPAARDRLAGLLRSLAGEGTAVLLATHDPHLAAAAADTAVRLDDGRCRAEVVL
ncbi:MAG: ATP-binding cassette domain-containing protein [Thermoleophilia bacterium]|nr:ATP-binding cassette domain-containing protein [Thermoleophilia bacterium]